MASRDGTTGVCGAHAGETSADLREVPGALFAPSGKSVILVCVGGSGCPAQIGDAKARECPLIAIQRPTTSPLSPIRAIRRTIGLSREGSPIEAFELGSGRDATLVVGGVHGDEPTGAFVVDQLVGYLETNRKLIKDHKVILVPKANPDGLKKGTRVNANGVDINRNFPTRDWAPSSTAPRFNPGPSPGSEPETKALLNLLNSTKPCKIISVHAPYRENNVDGPAKALAEEMARHNHYPVTFTNRYRTPGSLGTYAGKEQRIPTVTLELPPLSGKQAWLENRDALVVAIRFTVPCSTARGPVQYPPLFHAVRRGLALLLAHRGMV
jgi:protein MpaA